MIDIPEKFWRGDEQVMASTVGQLRRLLNQLPENLPIEEDQRCLTVTNINYPGTRLVFHDIDTFTSHAYSDDYFEEGEGYFV